MGKSEMNQYQLEAINEERLNRWKNIFNKNFSTPVILIGISHKAESLGQIELCVTDERTNEEIKLLLTGIINQL